MCDNSILNYKSVSERVREAIRRGDEPPQEWRLITEKWLAESEKNARDNNR